VEDHGGLPHTQEARNNVNGGALSRLMGLDDCVLSADGVSLLPASFYHI